MVKNKASVKRSSKRKTVKKRTPTKKTVAGSKTSKESVTKKVNQSKRTSATVVPVRKKLERELEVQKARDELESKIKERTAELEAAVELLREEISERKRAEDAVLHIAKGVSAEVGERFFYSLTENLAATLNADYAYVAEVVRGVPDTVRTLSLYADGSFIDNIEVNLKGTPCDTVREKSCAYPSGVQELFPHAKTMAAMNVEGYIGTPLTASNGEWIGLMAVMYREPVKDALSAQSMLRIFASRAAAELEREHAEREMKSSHSLLSSLVESPAGVIILSVDRDYNYTFFNSAHKNKMKTLWGADIETGNNIFDYIPSEEEREKIRKNYERVLQGEHFSVAEWYVESGEKSRYEHAYTPIYDEWNSIAGITVFTIDITERMKVEEALHESLEKYRALFEEAPVSIILVDAETGMHVEFNDRAHENLGYRREEFRGLTVSDYEAVESPEEIQKKTRKIMKEGQHVFETRHRRKDGQIRDVIVSTRAINIGRKDLIQGICQDITERKDMERSLWESEERFRTVMEQSPLGIVIFNPDGTIDTVNRATEEIWKVSVADLKENNYNLFNDEQLEDLGALRYIKKALDGQSVLVPPVEYDLTTTFGRGPKIWTKAHVYPVLNQDGVLRRIVILLEDITRQKNAEYALLEAMEEIETCNMELEKRVQEKTEELLNSQEQLIRSEKLSAMGRMAGGLAHELNSPLAGLLPMIEKHMQKAERDSREYKELSLMLKACEHMSRIVKDFSLYSRETTGEFHPLDLNEVIEDTLSFSENRFKQKGIRLNLEFKDALPVVRGEKTQLQQVILNMISNACDALSSGGELTIRTGISRNGKNAIMEFIDNGEGIEKRGLDKIFDPFYTTKRPGKGTGLGLSISYSIIEKHGGSISVESEPGKGTAFSVLLPVFRAKK